MFRRARELGPTLLVPLAWTVVTAAHLDLVAERSLFIAHVVMTVLLVGFAATGRADMREGALLVWWRIIAVGALVTLLGTLGFAVETAREPLWAVALGGWMVLPAVGFLDTSRRVTGGRVYVLGAAACGLGALVYAGSVVSSLDSGLVVGLALVGIGQTAGIFDAALRE